MSKPVEYKRGCSNASLRPLYDSVTSPPRQLTCALKLHHLAEGNVCDARVRDGHETRTIVGAPYPSVVFKIFLFLTIISADARKIVVYENIYFACFAPRNVRRIYIISDAYPATFLSEDICAGDRSIREM